MDEKCKCGHAKMNHNDTIKAYPCYQKGCLCHQFTPALDDMVEKAKASLDSFLMSQNGCFPNEASICRDCVIKFITQHTSSVTADLQAELLNATGIITLVNNNKLARMPENQVGIWRQENKQFDEQRYDSFIEAFAALENK